jgi:hypothetical protein
MRAICGCVVLSVAQFAHLRIESDWRRMLGSLI